MLTVGQDITSTGHATTSGNIGPACKIYREHGRERLLMGAGCWTSLQGGSGLHRARSRPSPARSGASRWSAIFLEPSESARRFATLTVHENLSGSVMVTSNATTVTITGTTGMPGVNGNFSGIAVYGRRSDFSARSARTSAGRSPPLTMAGRSRSVTISRAISSSVAR